MDHILIGALGFTVVVAWILFRGSKVRYTLIKNSSFDLSDNAANYASLVRQSASKNPALMSHYMRDKDFRGDRTPYAYRGRMMVWDDSANKYVRGKKLS